MPCTLPPYFGIDGFKAPRSVSLQAGKKYRADAQVTDPDADRLEFAWDIRPEVEIPAGSYAGSMEKRARPIAGLIRDIDQVCYGRLMVVDKGLSFEQIERGIA